MGGVPSCRCNKAQESNEMDMGKDKEELTRQANEQTFDADNNTGFRSLSKSKNNNFSNIISSRYDEEEVSGNLILQSKAHMPGGNLTVNRKDSIGVNNKMGTPRHKKQMSNEIKMEIYEDDIINPNLNSDNQIANIPNSSKISKLHSEPNSNLLTGSKPPLEVINEVNADVSKDSFDNANKLSRINCGNDDNNLISHEDNIQIIENNENQYSPDLHMVNQNEINVNSLYNTNENKMTVEQYNNMNFEILQDIARTNENSNAQFNSNNPNTDELATNELQQVENTGNMKIRSENENLRFLQMRRIITSIIPEYKLLNCDDDEVLFQSELKKLINSEITTHSSQLYSVRFCVVTKSEFRYYKSKEQFLTLQKPLCAIPFHSMAGANLIKSKNSKKYDHVIIKMSEFTKTTRNQRPDRKNRFPSMNSMDIDSSRSRSPITKDNSQIKGKKMTPLDNSHINTKLTNKQNTDKIDETTLIFFWEKEDILNKWAVVLNYFISS